MSVSEDEAKLFRQRKYNSLKWSTEEKVFRFTRKNREKSFENYTCPFTTALLIKYRKSVLGSYLDIFNYSQNQDKILNENKLGITEWDIQRYAPRKLKSFQDKNAIFENHMEVLHKAVSDCDVINLDYIKDITTRIELPSFYINSIDKNLNKFENLKILILMGNNLRDIHGYYLPRGLLYLELYDNFISNLENLTERVPNLLHLGLGRNKLSNDSSLHLLAECGHFKRLKNLDLSNNDIYTLTDVVSTFAELKTLDALSLQGNPCWTISKYKNIVLSNVPSLKFLDNVEVLEADRADLAIDRTSLETDGTNGTDLKLHESDENRAEIVFKCHRIMGLPKPPNDKQSIQTFHVEVGFPLLEEVHVLEASQHEIPVAERRRVSPSKASKLSLGQKKSQKGLKKEQQPSPYIKPDEYDPVDEKNNYYFKSERMPWNKIIEFPPVLVKSPEGNLVNVRDTFRSVVNVRVIYLKVAAKIKPKKEKKEKKEKKKEAKSTKPSLQAKTTSSKTVTTENSTSAFETPETILKKVTLCSFYCDMQCVNWSDETIDFYWADHESFKSHALKVDGCLKLLTYSDKVKKAKSKDLKKTASQQTSSTTVSETQHRIPNILTCQVGFGLIRSLPACS